MNKRGKDKSHRMIEAKQNLYKISGVFRCTHDVHRHFKSELSPFYILREKNCYPDGCVYFNWKCRLLAKQKTCFRGFSYVGRKCFNCRYFYEDKQHHFPEFLGSGEEYHSFNERFEEFEVWVEDLKKRRVSVEGIIAHVVPALSLRLAGSHYRLDTNGFLIRFDEGYIDNSLFSDNYYLSISALTQNKMLFRKGDSLEFEANLSIDRGRFKFMKPGRIQFFDRGHDIPLRKADVLVAAKTFTIQENQPEKCLRCEHGVLVDLINSHNGPSRSVVCLKGIANYNLCTLNIDSPESGNNDTCINIEWKGKRCHHVL